MSFKKTLYPGAVSRLIPLVVWMAFILFASIGPLIISIHPEIQHTDKLSHFMVYMLLGIILLRAWLMKGSPFSPVLAVVLAGLFGGVYGFFIEYVQYHIPDRSFEWMDGVADTLGALFGAAVFVYYRARPEKGKS